MTIALGIVAKDGIVVAADREVSVGDSWKGRQGKMWFSSCHGPESQGAFIASGSTDRMPYLEALARSLCHRFNDEKTLMRRDAVQGLLPGEIQAFHLRDVAPYADPPQISMVLGYQRNGHDGLWCADSGTITEAHSFAAVGIGGPLVETLLGRGGAEGPAAPRTDLFEVIKARVEKLTDAVRDSLG